MTLREYRRENKITQADFAKMVGTSQGQLSDIEKGKRIPSLHLAELIRQATNDHVPLSVWVEGVKLAA